ncbi:hypothetical protein ACTXT7_007080 [Hymenolepis weldensis]
MEAEVINIYKSKGIRTDSANKKCLHLRYDGEILCIAENAYQAPKMAFVQEDLLILALRLVIQEAIDRRCETVLIFADIRKVFSSHRACGVLSRL